MGTTNPSLKIIDNLVDNPMNQLLDLNGSNQTVNLLNIGQLEEEITQITSSQQQEQEEQQSLLILTSAQTSNSTTQALNPSQTSSKNASPEPKVSLNESTNRKSTNINKEWQFLQSAINEAGLTDFYQTYNDLTSTSSTPTPRTTSSSQNPSVVSVNDMNIETILQMQCELLDQQKELKSIELETMDQLRLLQQNIGKLSKKFDNFESSLNSLYGSNSSIMNPIKSAKNVFNKLNSTFGQQLKLVEGELLKEFIPTNSSSNNSNISLISPSVSTAIPVTSITDISGKNMIPLGLQIISTTTNTSDHNSNDPNATITLLNHGINHTNNNLLGILTNTSNCGQILAQHNGLNDVLLRQAKIEPLSQGSEDEKNDCIAEEPIIITTKEPNRNFNNNNNMRSDGSRK